LTPHTRLLVPVFCLALFATARIATADPFARAAFESFDDLNNNGQLDCGEPVTIFAGYSINDSGSTGLSGTLTSPADGNQGLLFEEGSVAIDFALTVACGVTLERGNAGGDTFARVRFVCAEDPPGIPIHTVAFRYKALYFNDSASSFQATSEAVTDDGLTFTDADLETFPTEVCTTPPPELAIDKTVTGTAAPGNTLIYTLAVTNNSAFTLGGIQLVDQVPAHTTFEPAASSAGWSCSPSNQAGSQCSRLFAALPPGTTTVQFAVRVADPLPSSVDTLTNTGCVVEGGDAPSVCDSIATPTAGTPALNVAKSLASGTASPGATAVFHLAVQNTGNQGAANVVLTETVPPHTTFAPGASSPGWSCSPSSAAGSACTFQLGAIEAGQGAQATFAVVVANPTPPGFSGVTNTACVSSQNAAEDCDTTTIPGGGTPMLSLAKTLAEGDGTPGSLLRFQLTVQNTGNQGATGVVLHETVPAHTVFQPAASSPGWSCAPGNGAGATCSLNVGTLNAAASTSVTYSVRIDNPLPAGVTEFSNTACARAPDVAENCDTITIPTAGTPTLNLAKSLVSGSASPGATLVFQLSVQNTGNQGAANISVTEIVPQHTTFAPGASSAGWTCSPNNAAGSICTIPFGTVPAGATRQANFAVVVVTPTPPGFSGVTNTACVSAPGVEEDCDTTTIPGGGTPVLDLAKTLGGGDGTPGSLLQFQLTVQNTGNQGAAGVVLSETVPDHTVFEPGASSPGWTCSPGNAAGAMCSLTVGTLDAAASAAFTYFVRVANPLPAGVTGFQNNACARAPDLTESCDTIDVPGGGTPNLVLTKTFTGDGPVGGDDLVPFDLVLTNTGNQGAAGVVLHETVPSHTTFEAGSSSSGWACTPDSNAGAACTLPLGTLAAGESVSRTFAVRAVDPLPPDVFQIANTACAESAEGAAACREVTTPPSSPAVLTATKVWSLWRDVADNGAVNPGDTLTYTVTLTNTGTGAATDVLFTSNAPLHTSLGVGTVTSTSGSVGMGNLPGNTMVAVTIPSLAAGASATITFQVTLDPQLPPEVTFISCQGSVSGANFPALLTDDPATAEVGDPTITPVEAGPGAPPPAAIPTVGEVGLLALVALLGAAGFLVMRRRGGAPTPA
jgi:uncharacterized repeat protein (TIGR01451 family)